MSWATDLWDQFDNISAHTLKGIDFCEKFAHFVKDRCSIENEYASKLKKLVKSYQPKKKEDELTLGQGFTLMIKEVYDIAGQHEGIAETLMSSLCNSLNTLAQELKQDRKKILSEGSKCNTTLHEQILKHDKAKKQYEKMFKEAEKALDIYKKAEQDPHLSRVDIDKNKQHYNQKQQSSEDAKAEYASELERTNDMQRKHFSVNMPQVFQQLQDLDEKKTARVIEMIQKLADIERVAQPIITKCIDGISAAATVININEDSQRVINLYKTGFVTPRDYPFEDLSNGGNENKLNIPTVTKDILKGTFTSRNKKRGGLLALFGSSKTAEDKEDFSHLPPNQQKKQLNTKIASLTVQLTKQSQETDALMRMKDVYTKNPNLGDAASLQKQLEESECQRRDLEKLLDKFKGFLAESDNRSVQYGSADNISDLYTTGQSVQTSAASNPVQKEAPVSSSNTTTIAAADATTDTARETLYQDSFEEEYYGNCVAVYAFDGASDGSIPMSVGQQFFILEQDTGDGWLKVRTADGAEGYVPSSYVQIQELN